jgi:peptidoglycan/xylan/chitin deacetylase (PgdA/CDA1 family)
MNLKPKKQQLLGLLPDALVLTRGARDDNARYLTFDDGPDPEHTPGLLDLLAKHGAQASFFLVGEKIEEHPGLVERILAEGHMLGNHSYSHWSFGNMSYETKLSEITRTDALLQKFDGRTHHRMRPPHGYVSADLLWYFARNKRSLVYWSYDSLDYQDQSNDALVARLRDDPPKAGDIVLMHDDSDKAGAALDVMLPEWLAEGHTFRALPAEAG